MKTKVSTLLKTVTMFQLVALLVCGCAPLEPIEATPTPHPQGSKSISTTQDETLKSLAEELPSQSHTEPPIVDQASQLPVRYQKTGYMIKQSGFMPSPGIVSEGFTMPVGADISSTTGPISLRDIMKRLAALKNMNVSWASDVDQYALVDVDIRAEEDFFRAIDNLLRQLDYFHEVKGNTIVVRYKETRKFHIALPFTSSTYSTGLGGDVLGASGGTNLRGILSLDSKDNTFDLWENIKNNLDQILDIWEESPVTAAAPATTTPTTTETTPAPTRTRPSRSSSGKGYYSIDRPIGLITVTAPRPLVEKIANYIGNLKSELYRQIAIEAKIIEVTLDDETKTGIDWSQLLEEKSLSFTAQFGELSSTNPLSPSGSRSLVLGQVDFDLVISAIAKQGETTLLSNPKISVMNGQPAMISIGESATYIDTVTTTVEEGVVSTSVTTSKVMSGLGLGVIATIMENNEIILSLTPVTSDLQGDTIEYEEFGDNKVGVPVVAVKELNTVVRVRDGSVLVVGGLIDKVDNKQGNKVPILGSLPIIKWLFSYEETRKARQELIIVLRTKIIS